MADDKSKAPPANPAPAPKKSGTLLSVLLSAVLAAGGAFGGARLGVASAAGHKSAEAEHGATVHAPGVTVPLDPFLVTVNDAAAKGRAIKVTLALELRPKETDESIKPFVPRIRDAALSYLRALSYEEATNSQNVEKVRGELLERFTKLGALSIEQVLIIDFVTQ